MERTWFERVRREHQELLRVVDRLADAADEGGEAFAGAVTAFLAFEHDRLRPWLLEEERELGPLLDTHLPAVVAASDSLRREHETLVSLLDRLRELAPAVATSNETRLDARAVVDDLALLLHEHVRREDSVLNPLLERLEARRAH